MDKLVQFISYSCTLSVNYKYDFSSYLKFARSVTASAYKLTDWHLS